MIRSRLSLAPMVGALLGATLLLGPAGAQQVDTATLQERLSQQRQALENVTEQLQRRSALVTTKRAQERSLLLELEAADRRLAVTRTEAELAARKVATHKTQTTSMEAEVADLEDQLTRQRRALAKHLRRLYRQRSLTTAQVLLTAPTFTAAAEQAKYTKRLAQLDRRRIKRYQATLREVRARRGRLKTTAAELTQARAAAARQAETLRRQVKAKRTLLASIQRERRLHEQALEEMEAAAQDLQELVTTLEKRHGASSPAASEVGLEGLPGPVPFVLLKGRLPWPTRGRLLPASGRDARLHRGLTIEASEGDVIKAVAPGTVVFADTFRGFGNLCILDHGTGYHTLYAHALEITVRIGEQVEAGHVIGRVGSSGTAPTPRLYFELRHRGRPIVPGPWMVARVQ